MATKKEMFVKIRDAVASNQEFVDFLNKQIESLERKSASPKKPTKVQLENKNLKADIVAALTEADTLLTIKELCSACESLAGLSNQRVTHLLTALRKEKKVRREYIKRVAHFAIGAEPDEE